MELGHEFNHKYGFGVIDAGHAVSLAQNWTNLGPEVNISSGTITVSQSIPDNDPTNPVVSTHIVSESLIVESVDIIFDADHPYRSDLDVTLISPDGTESELVNYFANRDSGNDYNGGNSIVCNTGEKFQQELGHWKSMMMVTRT